AFCLMAPSSRDGIETSGKFPLCRAGHEHVIILAPDDLQLSSRKRDRNAAASTPGSSSRNRSRTGRRPTGERQSRTTFPCAHGQRRWRSDLCEGDIGTFREHLVIFQKRPEALKIEAIHILLDPENRMRVAHRGG